MSDPLSGEPRPTDCLELSDRTAWDLLDLCDEATREADEALGRGDLETARALLDKVNSVIELVRARSCLRHKPVARKRPSHPFGRNLRPGRLI
jgi:hypothetical protein